MSGLFSNAPNTSYRSFNDDTRFALLLFVLKEKLAKPTPICWEIAFFPRVLKFSNFGQNAKSQFWPIFIAELRKPRKIRNTYQIWVKIALSDAEFIVVCVKTKTSKNQRLLAEKFLPRLLKIQPFWPKCKGPILADFHSWTSEASKNSKYLSDLSENCLVWHRIYCTQC